jgi:hypothetical protein
MRSPKLETLYQLRKDAKIRPAWLMNNVPLKMIALMELAPAQETSATGQLLTRRLMTIVANGLAIFQKTDV